MRKILIIKPGGLIFPLPTPPHPHNPLPPPYALSLNFNLIVSPVNWPRLVGMLAQQAKKPVKQRNLRWPMPFLTNLCVYYLFQHTDYTKNIYIFPKGELQKWGSGGGGAKIGQI